jgi:hypothetical protein
MMKVAIIWMIVAAAYSIAATILFLPPASNIIDASVSSDGSFFIILPIGITFILLVLPLFFVMFINNFIQSRKNTMPSDLTGKTGLKLTRAKELPNAALLFDIYINNNKQSKIAMGRSVFIELPAGNYTIQTKLGNKLYSAVLNVELIPNKVLAFETKTDINKSLMSLVPKGEMLFLVQIPYVQ